MIATRMILLYSALGAAIAACAQTATPQKKIIELGWDQPTTAQLRADGAKMEATAPFDGVTFVLKFEAAGKTFTESNVLGPTLWKREWLNTAVADMKAWKRSRFTDNFVRVNAAPGDLKWNDDKAWAIAAANIGQVAWFAKETGTKGILFDPESYEGKQYQWLLESGLTFEQANALARKRGAQTMRAIAKEYPNITFLSLWLLSLNRSAAHSADPMPILKTNEYGLWPAFVAGLVEAASYTMKLVDANENGYYQDDRAGYLALYNQMRSANGAMRRLLPPDVRDKYNHLVTAGFGFYLDRYINLPTDKYYIAPLPGGTSLERLGVNLGAAADISDEYVWVYGEQSRWWDPLSEPPANLKDSVGKGRLWEAALPGVTAVINSVRDPDLVIREAITRRTPAKNRAINPQFDQQAPADPDGAGSAVLDWKGGAVPGFAQWQDDTSKGIFSWDKAKTAARMEGVAQGCFIQKYKVKPGEKFLIEIEGGGAGDMLLTARWQTAEGKWIAWDEDASFPVINQADGTRTAHGLVTVPNQAGLLVALLEVSRQKPGESCWYDNLGVYRIQDLY